MRLMRFKAQQAINLHPFKKIIIQSLLLISSIFLSVQASATDVIVGTCTVQVPIVTQTDCNGQNLTGADFSGLDLSNAVFDNADLTNANFSNAVLNYARLFNATITSANFDSALLSRASFNGAIGVPVNTNATFDTTTCPDNYLSEQHLGSNCWNTFADLDLDGVNDGMDDFPNNNAANLDSDGDGYPDDWTNNTYFYCNTTCQDSSGLQIDNLPYNLEASSDKDFDGSPDRWNIGCDTACQSSSGLSLDKFPDNVAASADSDDDGFPDAWNAGCNTPCQTTSGLVLDAGQLYVDASKPWVGSNGLSWATAFPNITDALSIASAGQEIWIAAGVYYPDVVGASKYYIASMSFDLVNNVSLVGGFAGGETLAKDRNPLANSVVLSGDIDQNDNNVINGINTVFESGNKHVGSNSHTIVSATSVTARLSDLTITGGGSSVVGNETGGGIYSNNSNLELERVNFFFNRAITSGGAVYFFSDGTNKLHISDSHIDNNFSGNAGGGLYIEGGSSYISHTTISYNNSTTKGGGIDLSGGHKAEIINSTIAYNSSALGGGINMTGTGSITPPKDLLMEMSTIAFNAATGTYGGGLYMGTYIDVKVVGSVLVANTAPSGGSGNAYRTSLGLFEAKFSSFGENTYPVLSMGGASFSLASFLTTPDPTSFVPTQTTASLINNVLLNHGGNAPVLPLPIGSPLIDSIPNTDCNFMFQNGSVKEDQRHIPRHYAYDTGLCDIGAYERNDFDNDNTPDNIDNDIDNDGFDNNVDDLDYNSAAATDSDGDGAPDFFNQACDPSCQASSGLFIDNFPNNAAASLDSDHDGFPESWNAACNPTCQASSGLVLDAGQRYVDVTKSWAGSNGNSWAYAFPNIADALAVATPGQEIWIAKGVYYPDQVAGVDTNSTSATFTLKSRVNLVGGFAGNETLASQRDPQNNLVVLSGDITQNDTNVVNGVHTGYESGNTHNAPNSLSILTASGVDSQLKNLIISGGGNTSTSSGGAVNCSSSRLFFDTVKFFYNRANGTGGAINCSSSPTNLLQLNVVQLSGSYGGSIGGGIFIAGGQLRIDHSTIDNNRSDLAGGGIGQSDVETKIINSTIAYNSAPYAGGLYVAGSGTYTTPFDLSLIFSTVAFNAADGSAGYYGGGLNLTNLANAEARGTVFVGNTSVDPGSENIYRFTGSEIDASDSSFGSSSDGGLYVEGSGSVGMPSMFLNGTDPSLIIPNQSLAGLINSSLVDHGGNTPVLSLPTGSVLIDSIPDVDCSFLFQNGWMKEDQRGIGRHYFYDAGLCDIGAYERNDFDNDNDPDNLDFDDDNDGMPDDYEATHGFNAYLASDAANDADGDTLTNLQEFNMGRNPLIADKSEAETDLVISPRYHRYGYESASCQISSTPVTYTIKNKGAASRTITSAITFIGDSDWQLRGGYDFCSNQTLASTDSCTFQVLYCGADTGNSAAMINVPTDDAETSILTSALYNYESDEDEARRRLPPVLSDLVIRNSSSTIITDGQIKGGELHTYTWTITGYHPTYDSLVAVFNCNGAGAGTCGDNYSANFFNSGLIAPDTFATGTWTYNNIVANTYTYSVSFALPYSGTETNEYVLRFYRNSLQDSKVGNSSVSLLIPGNIAPAATGYYDTSGRRINLKVIP